MAKSPLTQHIQNSFLRLAITDGDFLRLTTGRISPEFFTSRITQNVAKICFNYFERFAEAPQDHFHDELVDFLKLKPDEEADEYVQYIKKIQKMPPPNREYILRRVGDFVKARKLEIALVEAADATAEGNIEEAHNLLYEMLRSGIPEEDAGLDYLRDHMGIHQREREHYLMPTGIKALDRLIGGFQRGQLLVTLGGYKAGKSWAMCHLSRTALLHGLSVLHISHELSLRETELRFDMMFSARGCKKIGEQVRYMKFDENTGELTDRKRKIKSVYDKEVVAAARKRVLKFGGRLRVKKYPMGQCAPSEIERYLNYLEQYEGFVPDVCIIDYLDAMNLSGYGKELRHQLNSVYVWAKGLADERNILVATVSQVVRNALQKRYVSPKDVAEDIRKVGNCDLMLAIGRGEEDVKTNLAGMNVVANRSGNQDCHCTFSLCYDIGQFCLSSWLGKDIDEKVYEAFENKENDTPE